MNVKRNILLASLFALTSCTDPLGVQESDIMTPFTWNTFTSLPKKYNVWNGPLIVGDNVAVEQKWWESFNDCTLNALIAEAIQNNKNLAIAATRIEEAKAARLAAGAILFPSVILAADASRGNQGFYTQGMPLGYEDMNIQANWEIDLFGKNQARFAATQALVQNEVILRQGVVVTLLAEVARNYFDLRNYERQIAITLENLKTQQRTLELTIEQFKGAYASDFDVQRAAAQVSTTEARIPNLKIGYETTRNRLNVLLGGIPGEFDELLYTPEPLQPLDPQILIAAPATVLGTRPDVRASERRYAASISENYAANRELFPTISLLAFYGQQGSTLFNTIPTWNIMGNLTQPLINLGRIEADIWNATARQTRAYLEYQQTILEALQDMEDALSNYLYENARNLSLRNAAQQNKKAEDLAKQQYTNGFTALLDVLVVQRNTLESESALAESDMKLRRDLVNIYTAAGGGWAY